jgi:hypothetical protein
MLSSWQRATLYRRTRGRDGLSTAAFEAATGHATEGVSCSGRGYRRWEGWCDSGTTGDRGSPHSGPGQHALAENVLLSRPGPHTAGCTGLTLLRGTPLLSAAVMPRYLRPTRTSQGRQRASAPTHRGWEKLLPGAVPSQELPVKNLSRTRGSRGFRWTVESRSPGGMRCKVNNNNALCEPPGDACKVQDREAQLRGGGGDSEAVCGWVAEATPSNGKRSARPDARRCEKRLLVLPRVRRYSSVQTRAFFHPRDPGVERHDGTTVQSVG